MLNTLHILRTSGATAGDCWGGAPSMSADNGLQPWIESDTLGCVNVLSVTASSGTLCRWEIVGNGAGAYKINDLDTVAVVGSYTAVALGVPTTIYAPSGTDDYGLYATIVVDTGAHAAGTITGRTIRTLNLPEAAVSASGYVYRCYSLYASAAAVITTVTVTGCTYSLTAVDPLGFQPVSASGTTQPSGITVWHTTGAESRTLARGNVCYLWIRTARTATPGRATATAEVTYTDGAAAENSVIMHQAWLQHDTSIVGYGIGVELTGSVDTGTPIATFAALPETMDLTGVGLPLEENCRVYLVNKYGLSTEARFLNIPINVDGDGVDLNAPAAPTGVTATDIGGGVLRVQATWQPTAAWPVLYQWKVKYSSTLLAETTTTVAAVAISSDGYYRLDTNLPAGTWGDVYAISVAAVCGMTTGAYLATTGSTTITTAVSDVSLMALRSSGQIVQATHPASIVTYAGDVSIIVYSQPGSLVITDSIGLVYLRACASTLERGIYLFGPDGTYELSNENITGSGSDPAVWGGSDIYLCAGGNRVVNLGTYYISCKKFGIVTTHCPLPGPVVETATSVYWQIFDLAENKWQTAFRVDSNGTVAFGLGLKQ